MAHRSQPKNHPFIPERGGRPGHTIPIPGKTKAVPGYPGFGPPLPGPDLGRVAASRSPPHVDKYYPEWTGRNANKNQLAESERLAAERLLEETRELLNRTRIKTKHDQVEVGARFKQRVGDIAFWKSELEAKLGELKDHLDELDSQHVRVEQALGSCSEPLSVAEQCLAHRNQRQGIDRCDDNVQKHLNLEIETLKKSQTILNQTALEADEEIRQMKKVKYGIEKDLVDKEAAIDIDQQTSALKVTGPMKKSSSRGPRYPAEKPKQSFTPSSWQEYTEFNLELSNKQIRQCLALQAQIDTVLAHTASHLKSQKDLTDRSFDRRIDEVKKAKLLLEKQLSETIVKINEMDESIQTLERAIAAKQGPLATCQKKIQQRKQRPHIEHVVDDVDAQLHTEAANLVETINRLEHCLVQNKTCYASLVKTRLELESQIDVKANSLFIDEVKCMSIRQGVNIQAY